MKSGKAMSIAGVPSVLWKLANLRTCQLQRYLSLDRGVVPGLIRLPGPR